jgi:outer membrane protein assembly factor BamD (BamD/ComL family)
MKYFMMIHPSQWNVDTQRMLNTKIAGDGEEDQQIIKRKILDLVGLFPKAYYYFGIVVHEYPESAWAYDSQEKMGKIEERIGMYRRIIESFTSWNVDKKDYPKDWRK